MMKSTATIALEYTTEETICAYASIGSTFFGDIILEAMGINGGCTVFCKCKNGGVNIGWMTRTGDEFMRTFSLKEIIESFSGKILDITTEVTKRS